MAKKRSTHTQPPVRTLRERAEELLRKTRTDVAGMPPEDVQRLVHELQVHQIELELQNEELRDTQVALTESRDRFSDLYEFAPVGYVTLDQNGRVVEANLTAATLLRVERRQLLNANLTKFIAPDSQDAFYFHRQAVLSPAGREAHAPDASVTAPNQTCELAMHRTDGTLLWIRMQSIAFGSPVNRQCLTALIDKTARRKAEDELRGLKDSLEQRVADQTQEIRLLAESVKNLAEGVMITDDELDWPGPRIRFVNEAMCRITGYTADELIGMSPRILQGKLSDRVTLDRIKGELASGLSCVAELVNYRRDGSTYDAEVFITPLCNASGQRTNFVSIHRDISERKRAEQELRERESRLSAILDSAVDAIITINAQGMIESVNRAAERMFGYAAAELIGRNVKQLMPPETRDEHDHYIRRYLETRQPRLIGTGREVIAQRRDGSLIPVEINVAEVDHLGVFLGILHDITERKRLQRQVLETATEEQRRIGQELHDGTQQELTGLSLMAGTLLHAIQSIPEKRVDSRSTWLVDPATYSRLSETTAKLNRGLAEAHRNVRYLAHGIMPVQIDALGLRAALEELVLTTSQTDRARCRFESSGNIAVPDNTVATNLYRIAQEAVNNALRHSRATEIVISLTQHDEQICLEVRDNGIGMPSAIPDGAASQQTQHMGLRIMEYRASLIGGTVRYERNESGGTTVRCIMFQGGRRA